MICWIRHLRTIGLLLCSYGLYACYGNESSLENTKTSTPKTVNNPVLQPLNCPAILTTRTYNKWKTDQVWLSFIIEQNKNYKPNLGDACNGDMKNLWQDLKRFNPLIEKHDPKISHISGLFGQNLNHFPATKEQVKHFVDKKAADVSLTSHLKSHDRSTLEGGLKIQRASRQFLMKTLQEYLDQEHKTIIEAYLNKHSLKMGHHSTEKLQFCYKNFNRCSKYIKFNQSVDLNNEFDFEFFGAWGDWWNFEHDKQKKTN